MKMQNSSRGLREFCRLLGFTPQAYYQHRRVLDNRSLKEDLVVQQVVLHRRLQPRLGTRKLHELITPFITAHHIDMGRDQLFELLRSGDFLIRRKCRKKPLTTFSGHRYRKYPDLVRGLILNRADELWVSDITYIHLPDSDFAYLSLVTDAYSRKIVGFCMNYDLSANGPVAALEMALKGRSGNQPLIHHSDRGSQYCSDEYVNLLKGEVIGISMTQSGDPRENAIAERVNGILKQELLRDVYANIEQAQLEVAVAIDIYNGLRPHSSVDMMTPELAHTKNGTIKCRWGKTQIKTVPLPVNFQQKQEV
jgi:putative transposase